MAIGPIRSPKATPRAEAPQKAQEATRAEPSREPVPEEPATFQPGAASDPEARRASEALPRLQAKPSRPMHPQLAALSSTEEAPPSQKRDPYKKPLTDVGRYEPEALLAAELEKVLAWQAARDVYVDKWRDADYGCVHSSLKARLPRLDRGIAFHITPDDLAAAQKEVRGVVIRDRHGKVRSHIAEVSQVRDAIATVIGKIDQRLEHIARYGEAGEGERALLLDKRRDLEHVLTMTEFQGAGRDG